MQTHIDLRLRDLQKALASAQHDATIARKEAHQLRQALIAALQHQIFLTGRIEGAAITGDRDVLSLQGMIDRLRSDDHDALNQIDHDRNVIRQGQGVRWF